MTLDGFQIFTGTVVPGFQFASGEAVGRTKNPSPFPQGTLKMQAPHFLQRGFDISAAIPGVVWATINIRVDRELLLGKADRTLELVDWTRGTGTEIPPETFSFTHCVLVHHENRYSGLIYYPHPETKPPTNDHDFSVIEVLTSNVRGLRYGDAVSIILAQGAFEEI